MLTQFKCCLKEPDFCLLSSWGEFKVESRVITGLLETEQTSQNWIWSQQPSHLRRDGLFSRLHRWFESVIPELHKDFCSFTLIQFLLLVSLQRSGQTPKHHGSFVVVVLLSWFFTNAETHWVYKRPVGFLETSPPETRRQTETQMTRNETNEPCVWGQAVHAG